MSRVDESSIIQGQRSRRGSTGPTVADVARHAGVSPMTVSRVVNGDARVTEATRERVKAAVSALGYVPNPAARSLAGGGQVRVALLHANPSAAYLSQFLMGVLGATTPRIVLILEGCSAGEPLAAVVARLAAHRADAVLLPPPLCDNAALVAALARGGLAIAQVATGVPNPLARAVTIDDAAAARVMTAHLIDQGHRRIGFIAGAADQTASALRRAGFEAALRDAGIAPEPDLVVGGDFTYRSGLIAAEGLFDRKVTAIFASNDDMAAAAVACAQRRGLDVPRDVSIAGFDDSAIATTIWPELSTIRQPIAEMAARALHLLAGAEPPAGRPAHERLPFELVLRDSTGPVPGRGPAVPAREG